MDIKKIKIAKKNPRMMGKEAKKALGRSLAEFEDIAGITVNKRTGNLVSGNHRWEELTKTYNKVNLSMSQVKGEYYSLDHKGKFTGFFVRVVDWPESKELAANVTANSSLLQGEFTSGLQEILDEMTADIPTEMFEDLRLDELQIDIADIDDMDWDDGGSVEESARKKNKELPASKTPEAGEVREIINTIKINVPAELKETIKKDVAELFAKKDYGDKVVIV